MWPEEIRSGYSFIFTVGTLEIQRRGPPRHQSESLYPEVMCSVCFCAKCRWSFFDHVLEETKLFQTFSFLNMEDD